MCLSEAFSERHNPHVRELADVLYQPWVGFVVVDEILRRERHDFAVGMGAIADAIDRASKVDRPKSTVSYAMSHDEAGTTRASWQGVPLRPSANTSPNSCSNTPNGCARKAGSVAATCWTSWPTVSP